MLDHPESVQAKIFRGLEGLERLRKQHRAFSSQADFWTFDTGSNRVLGMARYHQGGLLICCFTFGAADYSLKKYSRNIRNLLTDEEIGETFVIHGYDFAWIEVKSGM